MFNGEPEVIEKLLWSPTTVVPERSLDDLLKEYLARTEMQRPVSARPLPGRSRQECIQEATSDEVDLAVAIDSLAYNGKIDNFATHLMLEQNLASDYLPVVGQDKQRREPSIDYFDKSREKLVRFVRKADGKLPGKGHAKLWIYICAITMLCANKVREEMNLAECDTSTAPKEPKIPYVETEILRFYNGGQNRKWCDQDYEMVRDGLRSIAGLSIEECSAFCFADGLPTSDTASYNGNLIYLNRDQGWFAPGKFLWESSWHNHKMALPLQTLHKLNSTSSMTIQLMAILCRRWYQKPEGVHLKLSTLMRALRIEGRKPTEALKTIRALCQTLAGSPRFLRRKPVETGKGLERKLHFAPGDGAKFPTREQVSLASRTVKAKRLKTTATTKAVEAKLTTQSSQYSTGEWTISENERAKAAERARRMRDALAQNDLSKMAEVAAG